MPFALLRRWLLGMPLDPLHADTRRKIALVTLFAWIGLGADGLSSANYGPEQAVLALAEHRELGLFLVIMTAGTVALIAAAYMQVIELFPSGGGGYKVASQLLNPYAGVVAGAALVIDYVLTIAISIAAAIDAIYSLLPANVDDTRTLAGIGLLTLLVWLNLRGMKESIAVLAPIFFGFLLTHGLMILFGFAMQVDELIMLVPRSIDDAATMSAELGWFAVFAIMIKAYAVGAGTYTGIEAVSNNVHTLAEPRIMTGRRTMMLMAASLAATAGGIMLLYLIWNVQPQDDQTLNAVTFRAILDASWFAGTAFEEFIIWLTLALAAALLLVAANTGFLGGPAVMANMAIDRWVPNAFADLSSRLVTKVGVLVMGLAALAIYLVTNADVRTLVILYSINVFLAFSLSLLGLVRYRWQQRAAREQRSRLVISATAALISWLILIALVVGEFNAGGWLALVTTGLLVALCMLVRRHYEKVSTALAQVDEELIQRGQTQYDQTAGEPDPADRTAVLLVSANLGAGMHTLLAVQRLFPRVFQNFIFVTVGEVDAQSYGGELAVRRLKQAVGERLAFFRSYSRGHGWPSATYHAFGTDVVRELLTLCEQVRTDYPNAVFFATRVVLEPDTWLARMLHNRTAGALQRRLHLLGSPMMILPMLLELEPRPKAKPAKPPRPPAAALPAALTADDQAPSAPPKRGAA